MTARIRVLLPLASGFEDLEAVTLSDLLRRAGFEVVIAGLDEPTVRGSRGLMVLADTTLAAVQHDHFDLVALPGGLPGADHLAADLRLRALLQRVVSSGGTAAAVCAAPKALAAAGLLDGRIATAYPGSLDPAHLPGTEVRETPLEQDGPIVTSRGPGTAMDFALTLIERLAGAERRQQVEAALLRP